MVDDSAATAVAESTAGSNRVVEIPVSTSCPAISTIITTARTGGRDPGVDQIVLSL